MKKPVFADVAALIGGLLAAEKKKKKRRSTAPSKYDVIGVQKLVKALPARPARLPVVLVPGARRGRPPGSKNKKKIEPPETAEDLALEAKDELEEARELLDKAVVALSAAEASAAGSSDADRRKVLAKIRYARTAVTVKTKQFKKAEAKAEAANDAVARLEEDASPASDELLEYLDAERPSSDFFETLRSPSAPKAPPSAPKAPQSAFKEAKKKLDAARAVTRAEKAAAAAAAAAAPASPSAFTEAKKRVDATRAKTRAAAARAKPIAAAAAPEEPATPSKTRGKKIPPPPPGFPPGDPRSPVVGMGRFLGRFE
jgi:hypothetical protein